MNIEKTMRLTALFDFYGILLTQKQRNYLELYYEDDLSLGEIAEQYDVSRQAIYDNIRRTEKMLEDYEKKLQLHEKYLKRQAVTQTMRTMLQDSKPESIDCQALERMVDELEVIE